MPRRRPIIRPFSSTTGPPLEPGVTQMFSLSLSSETELTMPWVTAGVISGEMLTTDIQAPGATSPASPIARGGSPLSLARTRARWVSESNPRNSASIFRLSPVMTVDLLVARRDERRRQDEAVLVDDDPGGDPAGPVPGLDPDDGGIDLLGDGGDVLFGAGDAGGLRSQVHRRRTRRRP